MNPVSWHQKDKAREYDGKERDRNQDLVNFYYYRKIKRGE